MNTRSKDDKLRIIPIQADETKKKKKKRDLHPNLPDVYSGSLVCCVGGIKSGKSTILQNLLLNENMFNDIFPQDCVTIISPTIAQCQTSRFCYQKYKNNCHEIYNDKIITNLVKRQKDKIENKAEDCGYAVVVDDSYGNFPKNGKKNMGVIRLSTRFRHYSNGDPALLIYSTQKFMDLNPVIRANLTDLLFSGMIRNQKELEGIFSAYGDSFGGEENLKQLFKQVQGEPYQWLYLRMDRAKPEAYKNFTTRIF